MHACVSDVGVDGRIFKGGEMGKGVECKFGQQSESVGLDHLLVRDSKGPVNDMGSDPI